MIRIPSRRNEIFVLKIVLTYCEKKMFKWLRKNYKFGPQTKNLQTFWDHYLETRTIYSKIGMQKTYRKKLLCSKTNFFLHIIWTLFIVTCWSRDDLRVVHKLHWQDFGFFWQPTPLCWHFLLYECWQKVHIFGLPTPLLL